MDVLGANVFFDGPTFRFASRHAGAICTTAGALHMWGVNRGRGTALFSPLAPGVLFDAVVVINPGAGTVTVNDLINATSTPLTVGAVSFAGADLAAVVSAALLPTLAGGFAPSAYTANLWPRVGAGTTAISEVSPNNSNLAVAIVPELRTAALLLPAAGLLAGVLRRRRAVCCLVAEHRWDPARYVREVFGWELGQLRAARRGAARAARRGTEAP